MPILGDSKQPLVRNHQTNTDMKRKYCLIRMDGELSPGSFIFVVWVGSSLRESATLALVEEFCKDCGWYFKRWCREVDSALELRTKYARVDGNPMARPYGSISMNIQECYNHIIDDDWITLERNYVMTPQEKFSRFHNDPDFLTKFHGLKRGTSCPPSVRKYLSHSQRGGFYSLAAPAAFIVFLIVLDAIVTQYLLNI